MGGCVAIDPTLTFMSSAVGFGAKVVLSETVSVSDVATLAIADVLICEATTWLLCHFSLA